MRVQIDQSGKLEMTSRPTVISFSNGKGGTVKITAATKKQLQKFYRSQGRPRVYVYRTFARAIFLLLEPHLSEIQTIEIDKEYPGKEDIIKSMIGNFIIEEVGDSIPDIYFVLVGRKSKAHELAYLTFRKRRKADKILEFGELV